MTALLHAATPATPADMFEAASIIQDAWKTYINKKHTFIVNHFIPQWRKFMTDTHTHWKWTAKNLQRKHPKIETNKFPVPIFSKDGTPNKEHGGIKLRNLTQYDLIKLYTLGNPLIPEKQGGLKLKDIYIHIHNSGNVLPTEKYSPNKPFFHFADHGRTITMSLRRIWSIINQD